MSEQVGAERMRELARTIAAQIPGLGFALFVFELNKPGMSNYISNGKREDMVTALNETVQRLKSGSDFPTPDEN